MIFDVLEYVISVFDVKGIDYWWIGFVEEFVFFFYKGQQIIKGFDMFDVWFDSGFFWIMFCEVNF